MEKKTIIVGGGMAGMACALKLKAYNQDFMLITEGLGGRVLYSEEFQVNYGALFMMQNYRYAKQILKRETWVNVFDVMFHDSPTERFTTLSTKALKNLPSMLRFMLVAAKFFPHYQKFKRNCLTMPIREALELDPYMKELFDKPAAQFVAENRLQNAVTSYMSKVVYACTLTTFDKISTLDFMNVSLSLAQPIYLFSFDEKEIRERLKDNLDFDTITALEKKNGGYALKTKGGKVYEAAHVVLATPASVTADLLGIEAIRGASKAYTFHIKGRPKAVYAQKSWNVFSGDFDTSALIVNADGSYMLYSRIPDIDLNEYFETHEVIARYDWEKALYVHGREFVAEKYDEHLYIAGDHNGLGLEPAAISGIHAANQVMKHS